MIGLIYRHSDRSERAYKSYSGAYLKEGSKKARGAFRNRAIASLAARFKSSLESTLSVSNKDVVSQSKIGYKFGNQQLVVEAIKIGSLISEGLEFVGDAALELANARYWTITLYSTSAAEMFKEISVEATASHNKALFDCPSLDFWMEVNYPEYLTDAVKALSGALYVDSDFNGDTVLRQYAVFEALLEPYIAGHILARTIRMSPQSDFIALW
ncbi:hypothetical protein BGX31_011540 [Mortierella sp. GBA43]|nr:hypothetical protein BGX31_011540 [Mortierella sp. GBA43]